MLRLSRKRMLDRRVEQHDVSVCFRIKRSLLWVQAEYLGGVFAHHLHETRQGDPPHVDALVVSDTQHLLSPVAPKGGVEYGVFFVRVGLRVV